MVIYGTSVKISIYGFYRCGVISGYQINATEPVFMVSAAGGEGWGQRTLVVNVSSPHQLRRAEKPWLIRYLCIYVYV